MLPPETETEPTPGGNRQLAATTNFRAGPTQSPRASILLVDDHPANLVALEAVLEPLRQETVRASSGEQALDRLAEREFAVVVMDVRMPGMDGDETAARSRERASTRLTPIIFIA